MEIKWFTIVEAVDIETGEIIPRYLIDQKIYRIISKKSKFEQDEKRNNIKKITWECRRHEQYKLF